MPDAPVQSTDLGPARIRNAVICFAIAVAFLGAGAIWLGAENTFDVSAADFMPMPAAFAGAFALFGFIHLGQAALDMSRRRKFGQSTLEAGPAVLGAPFTGRIRTAAAQSVTGPYRIVLRCQRSCTADDSEDGSSRARIEHLWEASQTISQTDAAAGVPFSFFIPAKGVPSRDAAFPGDESIVWILTASAPARGMNYFADFRLDVAGEGAAASDEALAEFRKLAQPEQPGPRFFRRVLAVVGPLILALGLFALGNQAWHSLTGTAFSGRIAAIGQPFSDVALDQGGAPVKVRGVTKHQTWTIGLPVAVTCRVELGEPAGCRMDTGFDRWIDAAGTALVGLAVSLAAVWFWRRRRRP